MRTGWLWLSFMLGCGGLALLAFPHWREGLWHQVLRVALIAMKQGRGWSNATQTRGNGMARGERMQAQAARRVWRAVWLWWVLGLLLVSLPVFLVVGWSMKATRALDGFDDRVEFPDAQVTSLLAGEQLTPPPPLPPDVFTTADVEGVRPMLSTADRRWEQMDLAFVQHVLAVFKVMKERHAYEMALLEGYRSPERQNMLAAKGSNVTMAGAWQSYHQYGLAADCAFYRDGKLVISEKDEWAMKGYRLYGQVAEQMGLTWGGRWQMMDLGHIEWRRVGIKPSSQALLPRAAQPGKEPLGASDTVGNGVTPPAGGLGRSRSL